jgi:phage terminase large subunit-like protein
MLSNTATPRYYGEFRDKVLDGEIVVNQQISMEMNRIDKLIANPNIYYDDRAVEGWIRFCENELVLTDGSDFKMLESFKLWGEQIFGWYWFVEYKDYIPYQYKAGGRWITRKKKYRLINKMYLIVARGAAKSIFLSFIQAYFLLIDTSTTQQVTTAPTMKQAEEVMSPIRTAITRSKGPLFKFLTEGSINNTTGPKADRVKLASTKKGIENLLTGSLLEIRPMSINKLQGLRCKIATIDEWLSGDTKEDVIGALEQGASKIDNYLIVAASSEGTVRNGVGDTIKMELMDILNPDSKYDSINTSIWYYRLDDISEVADPEMWIKANPNIGITVKTSVIAADVERSENAPATRNDILAKRFGIPMQGFTYYFSYAETLIHKKKTYKGMPCALGADLSQGDDFCAFTFMFPLPGDAYGVKTRSYISSLTYQRLPGSAKEKYNNFMNEGTLIVMDSTVLDMMDVYDDLMDHIDEMAYDIRCFGYDPYNAADFVERWEKENGPYGIEKVIQGAKTESVPLGELKMLSEERLLLFDEELMSFAMGNCITLEDTNGNRKLYKRRHEQKIDNVAAMMDAYIAYKLHKEDFY